jgi:steroid 5-alpha reductase family enzyme
MSNLYLESALVVLVYMHLAMVVAFAKKDNGLVDVFWGGGFSVLAWYLHFYYPHTYSLLVAVLITIWGLRLSTYIGLRNHRKKQEDWRYAKWREDWGRWFYLRSWGQVFLLQGFFMWVVALGIQQRPASMGLFWYQYLGIGLWLFGLLWESIADAQLYHFKARPENKGKILMQGLWKYSRHPNYFGEAVLWWGIFLLVLPWGQWYWSCLGAATMTWLLTRVSGVPFLEWKYREHPEYQVYIRNTPAFIPDLRKLFSD